MRKNKILYRYNNVSCLSANPRLEVRSLEQQIILCYDLMELRQLLVKITARSGSRSVLRINPCWELPIPLQSVLVAMPKGM